MSRKHARNFTISTIIDSTRIAGRPLRWFCPECDAHGEAVFHDAESVECIMAVANAIATRKVRVRDLRAIALPNQAEAQAISTAHQQISPTCAGQPQFDLEGIGDSSARTLLVKVRQSGGEYVASCAGRARRAHGTTPAEAIAKLRAAIYPPDEPEATADSRTGGAA